MIAFLGTGALRELNNAQAVAVSHLQWQVPEISTLPLMNKASPWNVNHMTKLELEDELLHLLVCMYVISLKNWS